jgi:APA family basic amino acid/polyamine antiporter
MPSALNPSHSMKRVIGLLSGILMVPGIIIGTGIFKELGPMAASHLDGNTIILVWIAAGFITLLGALSVTSLTSLSADSGGEYDYLRLAFGKFTAFIFGWTSFTIIGSASVAAMSFIVIQSLRDLFPWMDFNHKIFWKLASVFLILLVTYLNIFSTKKSVGLNNLLTFFKFLGLLLLIIGGFFVYEPVLADTQISLEAKPLTGTVFFHAFMAAMMSAFWAYDGWLSIAFMGGEMKNPQRDLPKAIIGGVLIVILLYVLVNMAILRVIPAETLSSMSKDDIAATEMSKLVFGQYGTKLMSILIFICTLGALNGIVITYSRMYYKMALDGLFFSAAGRIHARYDTPFIALLLSMGVSCLLVFVGSFEVLTNVIVFAGYFFYALLAFAALRQRLKFKLSIKNILYAAASLIFILFSVMLLVTTTIAAPWQMLSGVGVMLLGGPIYFYFKKSI